MDDRHIRLERGDSRQTLAREGARDGANALRVLEQVRADVRAQHGEGQARSSPDVSVRETRRRMLLELEGLRPSLLDRVPQPMETADAGIAAPREDEPPDIPCR
jgi:hypothetical protein